MRMLLVCIQVSALVSVAVALAVQGLIVMRQELLVEVSALSVLPESDHSIGD